mgnify:FL=1
MKTLKLIGMALLAIVMSVSFIACSNDDDDDKEASTSLVGTTWKVTSVDNADEDFNGWTNVTATFNEDGTVTFNPNAGWNYTRWTLNDKTLKIVVVRMPQTITLREQSLSMASLLHGTAIGQMLMEIGLTRIRPTQQFICRNSRTMRICLRKSQKDCFAPLQ